MSYCAMFMLEMPVTVAEAKAIIDEAMTTENFFEIRKLVSHQRRASPPNPYAAEITLEACKAVMKKSFLRPGRVVVRDLDELPLAPRYRRGIAFRSQSEAGYSFREFVSELESDWPIEALCHGLSKMLLVIPSCRRRWHQLFGEPRFKVAISAVWKLLTGYRSLPLRSIVDSVCC